MTDDPLALCLAGRISAPVAIARLVLAGVSADAIAARLEGVAGAGEMRRLAASGLDRLAGVVAAIDHRAHGIADFRDAFDRAAAISPEASVAAYSLGDPALLDAATAELVAWLDARGLADGNVLDLGCGIGRVAAALGRARSVLGVDISPAMIAEARRRHGADRRLRFEVTDGRGILRRLPLPPPARGGGIRVGQSPLPSREEIRGRRPTPPAFDLILAVDSFPYLVAAGVAERHAADAARVLRPGGTLAVFNLSYQGLEADRAEARAWAGAYGFRMACEGEQPFRVWDGRVFLLVRQ